VDRTAREALTALNDRIRRRGGITFSRWPRTPPGWSPVEEVWSLQPWVIAPRWQRGQLRFEQRGGIITHWTPPQVVRHFVADWDAGKYPELVDDGPGAA
jgi:hypothetical protein